MDEFPYEMLEELKDGKAESTKYNSIKLQVNTPNTVLVFSNENPDKERMSIRSMDYLSHWRRGFTS